MSISHDQAFRVNANFNTEFNLDPNLDPLLGIHNQGLVNRGLAARDEIGKTSFSAVVNRVQYGTYRGDPACLVAINFKFHFKSKAACRYSYAEVRVTFTTAVDTQNHKAKTASFLDDPRVKNMAPMKVYGDVKTVGHEEFYERRVPDIFESQIGTSNSFGGTAGRDMLESYENLTSVNGRLYFDDYPGDANAVAWDLDENPARRDGIFPELNTAIIILNPANRPMWMKIVVKPSVRFFLDPRYLLKKNGALAPLLQRNDEPVLLDGKTPKPEQPNFICSDFSSPMFPWNEVLKLPTNGINQFSTSISHCQPGPEDSPRDASPMISTPVSISSQKATTSKIPPREFRAKDYNVAWICALPDVELLAARLMLDEYQAPPSYDSNFDDNTYIFGRIHGHRIVLASLQNGQTGNINAARLTGSLFKTFPNIKIALLVGIGGGVPRPISRQDPLEDIHLGDVVIGWPGDGEPAVICWDSGRSKAHGVFERLGTIDSPDSRLTQGLAVLASNHDVNQTNFQQHLARLRKDPNFARPGLDHDRLFESTYHHVGEYNNNCALCDPTQLVKRNARVEEDEKKFIFHRGRIATGSSVVQDAELRDRISKDSNGVLCIEMEAAGVDVNAKCLVIRGISDYADSHKNDSWKFYAAGNAAAFAREFLCTLNPTVIEILKREA